jgi:DNA primase large subunit
MDEDVLDAYVRSLAKSAEYQGKFINYVELRALIQRFKRLNPDADPKTVDWVGVWDERLEYSELLEAFRRNYPMYRWVEDGVTMEGFEDARKRRLERIVRELDEDSLRELSRLIREELGEEVDSYAEAAKTRVLEAVERGEKGVLPREDPIGDLVTYALARVLCLAIGELWLLRRWALAEAARMERYLHTEEEGLRRVLLRRILSIEDADDGMVGRIGDDSYRYRLSVPEYLRVSRGLDSPEWMLVNRMVAGGHVYLTTPEAIRLFRQRVYQLLSSMEDAPRVDVRQLPPRMQEAAMDVVRVLVRLRSAYEEPAAAPAPGDWPPCMAAIRARVAEAGHKELFSLAAFMINRGYTKEEILAVLASRPDYNERIARYQVEHIAGERGGGTRYRPPSCSTMRTYGLCIEDGKLCPRSIRNPLEYRKPS